MKKRSPKIAESHPQFQIEELEQRILLSADLGVGDYDPAFDGEERESVQYAAQENEGSEAESVRRELVIVDRSTPDHESLTADILAQQDDGREFNVAYIDSDRDGVEQLTEILSSYSDLDAVHLVSHGSDGQLQLGTSTLDLDAVFAEAGAIEQWGQAFTADGDLLIYGCDLAASDQGMQLVNSLASLTGADVAASDDLTGAADKGGDWDLEYNAGDVESLIAFSLDAQANFTGTLDTYLVTNTNATGAGSLEQAILDANANVNGGTPDEIHFNIGAVGSLQTITVGASGLTWISESVILDGTTQGGGGYAGDPLIQLDGSATGASVNGITITGNDSTVKGFIIHSFGDEGFEVRGDLGGGDNNVIQNNWVGIDSNEDAAPNGDDGIIFAFGASGNIVGGSGANEANVFAGNLGSAIVMRDAGTDGNIIQGNYIGVLDDGTTVVANGEYGVHLSTSAGGNKVGGVLPNEGNTIVGNSGAGVAIAASAGNDNAVLSNTIHSNGGIGIDIGADGVTNNDVNDGDAGANDLLNFAVILDVQQNGADLDVSFVLDAPAGNYRIEFFENPNGIDSSRNGQGENFLGAVTVTSAGTGPQSFSETLIGVTPAAILGISATTTADLGGGSYGSTSEFGNAFAGTGTLVVNTTSDASDGDVSSIAALLANKGADGVISLREAMIAANNTANGASPDEIHFDIGGGGLQKITLVGSGLPSIDEAVILDATTQSGYAGSPLIELDGSGVSATAGIWILSDGSTVKGFIIHSFSDEGIEIDLQTNLSADNNIIQNNWIGVDSTGAPMGNADIGILITDGAKGNLIGGSGPNEGNVVAGNLGDGIVIRLNSPDNVVEGNIVGFRPDGATPAANGGRGIAVLSGSTGNRIGGTAAGAGNQIGNNALSGIYVDGVGTTGNSILGNEISSNGSLGIDLAGGTEDINGVTANDGGVPPDSDTGANNLQNTPVLNWAGVEDATSITVSGSLQSTPSTTFRIEFFASSTGDASGHGEAERYLDAIQVTTDANGDAVFEATISGAVTVGEVLTSTATVDLGGGSYGDSSEYSANATAASANQAPVISPPQAQTTSQDQSVTFSAGNGNAITVADTDAGANELEITLSVTSGALTLSQITNLTFSGGANGTASMTFTGALADINAALDGLVYAPNAGYNGFDQLAITANDQGNTGLGGAESDYRLVTMEIGATNADARFWLSTTGDVTSSGNPTLAEWQRGEALGFGRPNFATEPGATTGAFTHAFNLDDFAVDGDTNINALHYVTTSLTLGSGANSISLQKGDLLLSTDDTETVSPDGTAIHPGAITVESSDVFIFRPDVEGDYSAGSFIFLLDDAAASVSGNKNLQALTLVEQDVTVGDAALTAGEILLVFDGGGEFEKTVYQMSYSDVGEGTTVGTHTYLIDGKQLGIDPGAIQITGLDLLESGEMVGDTFLASGTLLVTVDQEDPVVGDGTSISVTRHDIFSLSITTTGDDTTTGTAALLFEGLDVNLDADEEALDALSLIPQVPPVIDLDANDSSGESGADFSAAWSQGAGAVVVADIDATLSDADSQLLASLTVTISNPLDGAFELLTADTSGTAISASYDSGTGVLSLTGVDLISNYEQVLRTVSYDNSAVSPDTTDRIITFVVNDGEKDSNVATTTLTLNADVTAPIVTVDPLTTGDSTPAITGTVDDPTATIVVTVDGNNYNATNNGNGTWTLADNTINPALLDGTYDVAVAALDGAGNTGNDGTTDELVVDLTAPTVMIDAQSTNDTTPAITGTVNDPNATIVVTVDGNNYNATNNGDGTWTLADNTIAPALLENTYDIVVVATDAVGNIGTDATTDELTVIINDAPVNNIPPAQSTDEDVALVFSSGNGNQISVSDVDSPSLRVTLTANNGTLTLSTTQGLVFTTGTGTADASMTFSGTKDAINTALNGLSFAPTAGFSGAADIQILTEDLATVAFGEESVLGSSTTVGDLDKTQIGTQVVLAEDGTVTSLSAYLYIEQVQDIRFGLYSDVAGEPGTLLVESAASNVAAGTGWFTLDVADTALSAGTYWLALDVGKDGAYFYDSTGGETRHSDFDPKNGFAATWQSTVETNTRTISAFANYTPNGATVQSDFDTVNIDVGSVPDVTVDSLTTNDSTPQLTGTIDDATASITVTVDGNGYAATNNGNGTWTLADNTISPALLDGTYDIVVTATDTQGNIGTDATTDELVVDLTAPVVAIDALTTGDSTPTLTGTINDTTATIVVTVAGTNYNATNNGNGTWTLADNTISPALLDGTYDIVVTATDAQGNIGTDGTTDELIVDLTAPVVTIVPQATNDATPALSGTVNDSSATIVVTVAGTNYNATNNGDGTWTLADNSISPALLDGIYDITVTATDAQGNIGTDATTDELVVDLTVPTVTIDSLTTGDSTPALTGTVNDTAATIVVTVAGTNYNATNNGDGTWTLADNAISPALLDGTYDIAVTATDNVGNIGTDATTDELIVDLIAPTVAIDALTTGDSTPALTGTIDDTTATIVVTVAGTNYNATNNGDGTWTLADNDISPALLDGTYDIVVTATDTQGNIGTDATTDELIVDLVAPIVTVDGLVTVDSTPQLTGTVNDASATIVVTVNGTNYNAVNNGNGTWVLADNTISPALLDGTYNVTVTATDAAGNAGADLTIAELTVDTTAPVVTIDALTTNDSTPALTGTVSDPLATVVVTIAGNNYNALNLGTGTWLLADNAISPALLDGTYDIVVTATDAQGNIGTDATINELLVDISAPLVTVDILTSNDSTPALSGTVNDPAATIVVTVNGTNYNATNNGDGTWTLADNVISPALADGVYDVSVAATDSVGNVGGDLTVAELTIITNVPPVAVDDVYAGSEDTELLVDQPANGLLANDLDLDGDTLTVNTTPVVAPGNGTVVINADGTFSYTPNMGFTGIDSFTYSISDGNGNTAQATVTINVAAVNQAPQGVSDQFTTVAGLPVLISELALLANDIDADGDLLSIVSVTQPGYGSLAADGAGNYIYTPGSNFDGIDFFTYTVADESGETSVVPVSLFVSSSATGLPDIDPDDGGNDPGDEPDQTAPDDTDGAVDEASKDPVRLKEIEDQPDVPVQESLNSVFALANFDDDEGELVFVNNESGERSVIDNLIRAAGAANDGEYADRAKSLIAQILNINMDDEESSTALMWEAFDKAWGKMQNQPQQPGEFKQLVVFQSATGISVLLTAGYVTWALRGGALLSLLLSTMPVWKSFDPMPILLGRKGDDDSAPDSSVDEGGAQNAANVEGLFGALEEAEPWGSDDVGRDA